MAFTQSTIRTQLATLIDNSPNKLTVTHSGTDYDAVKTQLNRDFRYTDFGLQNDYRFSVMLSYSDFSTLPEIDETVTVSSVTYRILGIESDSTDATIRLDLGQQYA